MKKSFLLLTASLLLLNFLQAQVEPSAGTWKTWFIASGKDYRLPPPERATTMELKAVLAAQKNLDAATMQQIQFWNTGAPNYRWREILLGLADRNIVPGINMPYAAMLLNVAIYDAMVAAWDTKYAYKRLRPFAHAGIKALVPKPESYAYPCEHAVAAGAAATVIAYIFPTLSDSILQVARQAMHTRVAAGVSFPSDTEAGFELGKKVAEVVIGQTKEFITEAKWDGKIPEGSGLWRGKNPMGPQMGSWKTMVLTSGSQLRPGPPPDFTKDMAELKAFKPNFRSIANAYFHAGQNYWFDLLDKKIFEYNLHMNPPRAARMYALNAIARYDGFVACWDAKYAYWGIRPDQYDTTYRPVFPSTPNFPGYPSGHAAGAGTSAAMLAYFFPAEKDYFLEKAREAAESRFEGGIHFRTDNEVGLELGQKVAEMILERARKDGADNQPNYKEKPASENATRFAGSKNK